MHPWLSLVTKFGILLAICAKILNTKEAFQNKRKQKKERKKRLLQLKMGSSVNLREKVKELREMEAKGMKNCRDELISVKQFKEEMHELREMERSKEMMHLREMRKSMNSLMGAFSKYLIEIGLTPLGSCVALSKCLIFLFQYFFCFF